MITFITHSRVTPENAAAFEAVITDMCAKVRKNASVSQTSRLIESGKYDIKQYVSPGAEPVRRRQKPEAQGAPHR